MDFKDQVKLLSERVSKLKDNIHTEEATKNAIIMPFIQALGYDVFDPTEVVPEFICDIGTKKGEKIDYAIFKEGQTIILIECKHWKQKLDVHDGQLLRYFHVSHAKFGVLTNGLIFRFYTDLVEQNKMDEKPFLEFNIEDIKEGQIEKLKDFHKNYFDQKTIYQSAYELKDSSELRQLIQTELQNPSDEFVRFLAKQVYPSVVNSKIIDYYRPLIKRTFANIINDTLNDRLKSAITNEEDERKKTSLLEEEPLLASLDSDSKEKEVVTTEEELEAFYIIRSILRPHVEIKRVTHRDALSYFAVFLDDNNRKPICRLYLNSSTKKYMGLFGEDKKETKIEISTIDDIYEHQDKLISTVSMYR